MYIGSGPRKQNGYTNAGNGTRRGNELHEPLKNVGQVSVAVGESEKWGGLRWEKR